MPARSRHDGYPLFVTHIRQRHSLPLLSSPYTHVGQPHCCPPHESSYSRRSGRSDIGGRLAVSLRIQLLPLRLRGLKGVNVGAKLDDLAEQIAGFALPIRHGFVGIGVPWGELEQPKSQYLQSIFNVYIRMTHGK